MDGFGSDDPLIRRLFELHKLREINAITDEEFDTKAKGDVWFDATTVLNKTRPLPCSRTHHRCRLLI